jgi:glycosyltransferase involved in cell wall biosynthesis
MELPLATVLIVTYDRPSEIRRTIAALDSHIQYPRDRLRWHLSDDGSPLEYIPTIQKDFPHLHFTATVTERKGWGANVNKGMGFANSHLHCDYIFLCEDDYVALKEINIRDGVMLMETIRAIGLVRYDGISAHTLNLYLREVKLDTGRAMDYMIIDKDSPHLNTYSHRPHLKHRRFHSKYGPYKEGITLGRTETEFAHRVKDKGVDGPLLAVLHDGVQRAFDHIGKSRQGTKEDKAV